MDFLTLFGIAVALAMDAFAVALAAGVVIRPLTARHFFRLGFHFGLFQALMPVLGWLAGISIQRWISAYSHWVAFALLALVGGHMIREALNDAPEKAAADPSRGMTLVVLSIATSIDALAVGLSLAVIGVDIVFPAVVIGLVAGILTVVGLFLGRRIGVVWGTRVEILGGVVLLIIGLKIVFEHTFGA